MTEQYVVRNNSKENFTIIPNEVLQNSELSWRARGILTYMLSMPYNWTFYDTEIQTHGKEGRDAFKKAMKELQNAGYVVKERSKNADGTFGVMKTYVYDSPQVKTPSTEIQSVDSQSVDSQSTDNPQLQSTYKQSTYKQSTHKERDKATPVDAYSKVINHIRENRLFKIYDVHTGKIINLVDTYLDADLIIEAFERSKASGNQIAYATSILRNWKDQSILNKQHLEEVESANRKAVTSYGKQKSVPRSERKSGYEDQLGF